ncbi:MAG TPA: hypothetical protein VJR23_04805 [Candidatus Acidoferrales bacterium]|nr:hypothetical protein [Candidatus Acidoferrales bacterium]
MKRLAVESDGFAEVEGTMKKSQGFGFIPLVSLIHIHNLSEFFREESAYAFSALSRDCPSALKNRFLNGEGNVLFHGSISQLL